MAPRSDVATGPQTPAPRVWGWLLWLPLLLALASATTAQEPGLRLALLVGVGSFSDPAFTPLQYAIADVEKVKAWLASPEGGGLDPAHIRVLKDAQATRAAILEAAEELARQARPQDLVLLYFSTHGFFTPQRVVGIVAHDSLSTGDRDNLGGPIARTESVLTRSDLRRFLEGLSAGRRLVILDLCHGGQLAGQGAGDWSQPLTPAPERTTLIMASCLGSERAWESQELKASIFTHYLVESLKASAGDVLAAFQMARAETERQASCEKDSCQTPYLIASPPGGGLVIAPDQEGSARARR